MHILVKLLALLIITLLPWASVGQTNAEILTFERSEEGVSLEWASESGDDLALGFGVIEVSTNLSDWDSSSAFLLPEGQANEGWSGFLGAYTNLLSFFVRTRHWGEGGLLSLTSTSGDTGVVTCSSSTGVVVWTVIGASDQDTNGVFHALFRDDLVQSLSGDVVRVSSVASDTPTGRIMVVNAPSHQSPSNRLTFASGSAVIWEPSTTPIVLQQLIDWAAEALPIVEGYSGENLIVSIPESTVSSGAVIDIEGDFIAVGGGAAGGEGGPQMAAAAVPGQFGAPFQLGQQECHSSVEKIEGWRGRIHVKWKDPSIACFPEYPSDINQYIITWRRVVWPGIPVGPVFKRTVETDEPYEVDINVAEDGDYRVKLYVDTANSGFHRMGTRKVGVKPTLDEPTEIAPLPTTPMTRIYVSPSPTISADDFETYVESGTTSTVTRPLPYEGWAFDRWSDGEPSATRSVVVSGVPVELIALYEPSNPIVLYTEPFNYGLNPNTTEVGDWMVHGVVDLIKAPEYPMPGGASGVYLELNFANESSGGGISRTLPATIPGRAYVLRYDRGSRGGSHDFYVSVGGKSKTYTGFGGVPFVTDNIAFVATTTQVVVRVQSTISGTPFGGAIDSIVFAEVGNP